MAINGKISQAEILTALDSLNWAKVRDGVDEAAQWLRAVMPGDPHVDDVVSKVVALSSHPKWEIRCAVANLAAHAVHPEFDAVLSRLAADDNTRVQQAATRAVARRRDLRTASTLGKQHEARINSTLDDIGSRFGVSGRKAVKRASEQIANTFSRELYHELIKLITPLAMTTERLGSLVADEQTPRAILSGEVSRMEQRIKQLRDVLEGMREYTAQPVLAFASESLREVVDDAAALVREAGLNEKQPAIQNHIDATLNAEVSRARFVQALTNVLFNSVEAYQGFSTANPIIVRARLEERRISLFIEDSGCGMSAEAAADAVTLFSTSKANGTGFGLPLAIKIVESEHAGRLTLESVKGRGTIVRIIVPMKQQRVRQ